MARVAGQLWGTSACLMMWSWPSTHGRALLFLQGTSVAWVHTGKHEDEVIRGWEFARLMRSKGDEILERVVKVMEHRISAG